MHIIGNGLIAKACREKLPTNLPVTVFACCVSNLSAGNQKEREREKNLLKAAIKDTPNEHTFFYFGTCSIFDPSQSDSIYCKHKLDIEKLVATTRERSIVLRLPQVVGHGGNPDNLANFLISKLQTGSTFNLWRNAYRSLLDVRDVAKGVKILGELQLDGHMKINMSLCKPIQVLEIIRILEELTHKKAKFNEVAGGAEYSIDTQLFESLAGNQFPLRDYDYTRQTLLYLLLSNDQNSCRQPQ